MECIEIRKIDFIFHNELELRKQLENHHHKPIRQITRRLKDPTASQAIHNSERSKLSRNVLQIWIDLIDETYSIASSALKEIAFLKYRMKYSPDSICKKLKINLKQYCQNLKEFRNLACEVYRKSFDKLERIV